MLIGELISRFDDEATAAEAVVDLDDLNLVARISKAAAEVELTMGEFVSSATRRFISGASDAEWVTLFGKLSGSQDPGRAFLHHVLSAAVAPHSVHAEAATGHAAKAAAAS